MPGRGRLRARAAARAQRACGGARMTGPRVLVVDDEPQILRALRTSLRGAGYEVDTAETAEAALAAAAMRPPEAVVLDLVLPDGSGTDVARELRSWSSAPIIVLSAVGEEREKVAALDAGADDYVTKPVGDRRAAGAAARRRCAARRPSGEPVIEVGELRRRPREARGADGGEAGPAHAAPVRPPPRPRLQRRQAADAPAAAAGGLGAGLRATRRNSSRSTSPSSAASSSPTARIRATS